MENNDTTIQGALHWASLFLTEHHREQNVAEILLCHHLGVPRSKFFAILREKIPVQVQEKFVQDIKAHAKTGIPVQHLTGYEMFYGRYFHVNDKVLIPRPETEELILGLNSYITHISSAGQPINMIDLGTGSGIIAVTLKLEWPATNVYATDISADALMVAKQNAVSLGADVTFMEGNFLQPVLDSRQQIDVIVSNPPYISNAEKDTLDDTVKNFDPELALFAEQDGLAAYHTILTQAQKVVADTAILGFEIGHQQGTKVGELVSRFFPNSDVEVRQDINGKDRMVFATVKKDKSTSS
ncbi:peptide chain release factor N(5)-glutamine methyltransferase [Terrihalobacillus insolitus]|uniref:peptide chain release factor N(5)-glutamine methyltransferase n=1 Tax=Terrihalobacillus insolitus TaxID=2950438 RepID=UPI002340A6FE|nr:peptide chain release factor N(5)-glutamine methyltransferase [Terrihalobacillus insolitus]MDC3411776.1 peptide chain release factor N(5)-glutamine methyltransferase [Terrihalobacillus insolitus]